MTGLRERNKEEKRRRLQKAAARLFKRHGYEATTLREIAQEADLGLGTIYAYVRDKVGLLEMISTDDLARVQDEAFSSLPVGSDFRATLGHVFQRVYAHHAADVELARIIVKELTFSQDETQAPRSARMLGFVARIAEQVSAAQQRGELRADQDPMEVALLVFGVHFFHLVAWLGAPQVMPDPLPRFLSSMELVLTGLEAPRAEEADHGEGAGDGRDRRRGARGGAAAGGAGAPRAAIGSRPGPRAGKRSR